MVCAKNNNNEKEPAEVKAALAEGMNMLRDARWLTIATVIGVLIVPGVGYGYAVDGFRLHNPDLFNYVKEYMPKTGTLKTTNKGFVYVDIDNNYLIEILKQLKDSNYKINRGFNNIGANIAVISPQEVKGQRIREFGKKIAFSPLGFYTVVMDQNEYLMLAIDAPELVNIRTKYGLAPKPHGHTFNIILGVRKFVDAKEDELAKRPVG